MNLGQRIRQRRVALKLTQKELADALKFTPQHLSAIEQGKRSPSLSSVGRLAEELGVTVDYLVVGKESAAAGLLPAIKADPKLELGVKRALITLVQALYERSKTL